MKRSFLITCLIFFTWHGAAAAPSAMAQGRGIAVAITADVLSLETQSRIMVIRRPDGSSQRVLLDDVVGGFGDVRAGDRVVLTLRDEPGMSRVSSLVKSAAPPPESEPAADLEAPASPPAESVEDAGVRAAFGQQVASLAVRANAVDLLWGQFRSACDVRTSSRYEDAREWFGLWDGGVRADLSSGFCRDLFNAIVDAGASINASMEAAEDAAGGALLPGTMRDIRRRYAMDWEGWSLGRPERLER